MLARDGFAMMNRPITYPTTVASVRFHTAALMPQIIAFCKSVCLAVMRFCSAGEEKEEPL